MNNTAQTPRRRLLLAVSAATSLFLTGCGGGEENYETVDLDAAYDSILHGMSYTYVRSIVGREADSITPNGSSALLYRWETGRNTYLFSTLTVEIHQSKGAMTKAVTGPKGNRAESLKAK